MGNWYQFNIPVGVQLDSTGEINLSQLGGFLTFTAGVNYYFRVESVDGFATLTIKSSSITPNSKAVGGLRIKEIRSSDGILPANDIVKTYEYLAEGSSNSSGILYARPEYAIGINVGMGNGCCIASSQQCGATYSAIMFAGESLRSLSNVTGAHIYYARVKEIYPNNGYKIFNYFVPSSTLSGPLYPAEPDQTDVVSGQQQKYETYDNSSLINSSESNFVLAENTSQNAGNMYKVAPLSAYNGMCATSVIGFLTKKYGLTTKPYRLDYVVSMTDGLMATTDFSYDAAGRFLAPIVSEVVNSDGKVTRVENTYIHDYLTDYPNAGSLRTQLLNRNIIGAPYKTITKTGPSGNLLQTGGTRMEFAAFDDNGLNPCTTSCSGTFHVRGYKFYKYEMTWTSGTPSAGVWDLQGTVQSYNAQGKPTSFLTNNWSDPETYSWTTIGLLSSRTYKSHTTNYAYYPGTALLLGTTDIDGRKSAYTYDKLMRLTKTTQDGANYSVSGSTATVTNGNVKTEFEYEFFTGTTINVPVGNLNYVKSTTTYTTVANSSLSNVESWQYMDGLGRHMQTAMKGWSPTQVDVITDAVQYDNQGRTIKQYTPFTGGTSGAYTPIPVGQKHTIITYEASPLNRTLTVTPPDWYATTKTYGTNAANEVGYFDGTSAISYYPANSLLKTTTIVPQTSTLNNETITYKDKKGRQILSRSRQTGSGASTQVADTYFLFDDKDRLTRVYPPGISNGSAQSLYYSYTYDAADRMTFKSVPDAGTTRMRYNDRDQLVYIQDLRLVTGFTPGGGSGAVPSNSWMRTQYDAYGRPEKTGMNYSLGTTPDPNAPPVAWSEVHTETTYGTSAGINMGKIIWTKTHLPGMGGTGIERTMTYDPVTGRLVTNNGNNNLSNATGSDNYTYTYDYAGNVLTETRIHKTAPAATALTLTTRKTYDHSGRNTALFHKINANTEQKLGTYTYDFRDRMTVRGMGWATVASTSAPIQQLDYAYNEQNWLTALNAPTTFSSANNALAVCPTSPTALNSVEDVFAAATSTNDLFKLNLYYDSPQTFTGQPSAPVAQRNGNISQVVWQTRGRERQAYNVSYDFLDRMTTVSYMDLTTAGTANSLQRYQESVTYADLRGNISSIQRNGMFKNPSTAACYTLGAIDNLSYTYAVNTNRLSTVTDAAGAAGSEQRKAGFSPGAGTGAYAYDANGNMTSDPYKAMTLRYNHMNLPTLFDFGAGKTIEVYYDRGGAKLRKTVKTNATTTQYIQDYVSGMEYRTTGTGSLTLEAIYHAEGRITPVGANWQYEYSIKDHLGNTRLTFADLNNNGVVDVTGNATTTEILNEYHYYPFGMNMAYDWTNNTGIDNKYQYNRMEMNDDFGLNWDDYGFRWYDPSLARFFCADPLAKLAYDASGYHYASNNPMTYIDLFGLSSYRYDWETGKYKNADDEVVEWDEVHQSLKNGSRTVHIKSVSKKTDKMLNAAKMPLEQYLSAAKMNVRVEFYDSNRDFEIANMDRRDGVAVVSNTKKKTVGYIMKNFDGKGFLSARYRDDFLPVYLKIPWDSYPEVSDANDGWGYVIAVTVNPGTGWPKAEYNLSDPEFTAFMILHGMGHLCGIVHIEGKTEPPYDSGFMAEGPLLHLIMKNHKGNMVNLIKETVEDQNNRKNTMEYIWKRWNE
jgi:RHS repeat-associated protein